MLYWLSNSTIGFVVLFIKKNRLRSVSFIVHTPITSLSYLNSTFGVVVVWTNGIYFIDAFRWRGLRHMAQFFRHEMADGGNHASVGCTARHKCVSMAESCHPYGFGGGYGGYGAFFGLQRPPLSSPSTFLNFYLKMN